MYVSVSCCVQEKDNKSLLKYVVENFWSTLETVDYVDTFKNLKLKHEQEKEAKETPQNT